MHKERIEQLLFKVLTNLQIPVQDNTIEFIENSEFGDYATSIALKSANQLKQSPRQIAEKIAPELQKEGVDVFESITVAGPGFINMKLKDDVLTNDVLKSVSDKSIWDGVQVGRGIKVILEHTSSNPNKALHIGHLRNASIGDSLGRILKKIGFEVEIQFYNDNTGLQLVTLVFGIEKYKEEFEAKLASGMKFDHVCSDIYVRITKDIEENPQLANERDNLVGEIEEGKTERAKNSRDLANKVIESAMQTTSKFNVFYNTSVCESDIIKLWPGVFEHLQSLNLITYETEGKNKGCYVIKNLHDIDNPNADVPDKVLVRSNGTIVYTAKDIVYHLWEFGLAGGDLKFKDLFTQANGNILYSSAEEGIDQKKLSLGNAQKSITLIDNRQDYPQRVVKFCLDRLGYKREAENKIHLSYAPVLVSGEIMKSLGFVVDNSKKAYSMSGRKGNDIKVDDLLATMTERIKEISGNADSNILSPEKIAAGALKYFMLKYTNNNEITVDYEEVLKHEGNTGPYLQYAYARACGILDKAGSFDKTYTTKVLTAPERELLRHMSMASQTVLQTYARLDISLLSTYTFDLCSLFASFYQQVKVLDSENKDFKLTLVSTFVDLLGELLDLFGISYASKM